MTTSEIRLHKTIIIESLVGMIRVVDMVEIDLRFEVVAIVIITMLGIDLLREIMNLIDRSRLVIIPAVAIAVLTETNQKEKSNRNPISLTTIWIPLTTPEDPINKNGPQPPKIPFTFP